MKSLYVTVLLMIAMLIVILCGVNGADADMKPITQKPCTAELAQTVCCHPACAVYERRGKAQGNAQLSICWRQLVCPGKAPDAADFCGCKNGLQVPK